VFQKGESSHKRYGEKQNDDVKIKVSSTKKQAKFCPLKCWIWKNYLINIIVPSMDHHFQKA